jgi:hypothetical protein
MKKILTTLKKHFTFEKKLPTEEPSDDVNDRQLRNIRKGSILAGLTVGAAIAAPTAISAISKTYNKHFKKVVPKPEPVSSPTTINHIHAALKNIKDTVKEKAMENPKTAAALSTAGAIGAGYGAYKYIKHRKKINLEKLETLERLKNEALRKDKNNVRDGRS